MLNNILAINDLFALTYYYNVIHVMAVNTGLKTSDPATKTDFETAFDELAIICTN